jgi:flavin reductase (DIM6/NTAB) family NADH-FMN oxidoreductase RutF
MSDPRQQVLGMFDRTAWIVTASAGGEKSGLVATFVNSASLVPALPRLAAGIAQHHYTWDLIRRSRAFAAHLVDESQAALIWRFGLASGREIDKFAQLAWRRGQTGAPIVEDALSWLDCRVEADLDIGDRTIYVGAVIDGGVNRPGTALTANRIFDLATAEQRQRLDAEHQRDAAIDEAAMRAWRATSGPADRTGL